MPTVLLDHSPVIPRADARTVGDILAGLPLLSGSRRRLITTVECDGQPVIGDELNALMMRAAGSVSRLVLETEEQRTLVLSILRQTTQMLSQARELRFEIADQLTQGRVADAMNGLGAFVSIWGQSYAAITQCASTLSVDFDTFMIQDRPIAAHINVVAASLRDIKQALMDQDHVRLADQLTYELGPALDACLNVLRVLTDWADSHPE